MNIKVSIKYQVFSVHMDIDSIGDSDYRAHTLCWIPDTAKFYGQMIGIMLTDPCNINIHVKAWRKRV